MQFFLSSAEIDANYTSVSRRVKTVAVIRINVNYWRVRTKCC